MKFQVPQFIEVETKIFGPLTIKQFLYLAGGAGILLLLYSLLPFFLVFIFGAPVAGFSLALAFYRVNNQPFIKILENAVKFYLGGRLFLWRKEDAPKQTAVPSGAGRAAKSATPRLETYVPKLTRSKLKDLSWSLDINKES